jgi:quinol-cytochrome oxidoreductase complex cytochrome b subunit
MSDAIIVILLLCVLVALFTGLYFLIKGPTRSQNTVRSLTVRVGFTVALIIFLLAAAYMGWITPHPVGK